MTDKVVGNTEVNGNIGWIENGAARVRFKISEGGILHLGVETWVLATGSSRQLVWRPRGLLGFGLEQRDLGNCNRGRDSWRRFFKIA